MFAFPQQSLSYNPPAMKGVHHSHQHEAPDPAVLSSSRGISAVKWSFVALMATALFQLLVVSLTGSVALLADTIHNFSDAFTAIPLWIAFRIGRRPPSKRFPYGYGKVEDLAGAAVVLFILGSAAIAAYETIHRFLNPQPIQYLWAVAVASVLGFLGNELVAVFRIRVGQQIHSAALVADGYHARVDGFTSLGVLVGVVGVSLGLPSADPLVGFIITVLILRITWSSAKIVFLRMLDGIDPTIIDHIRHASEHIPGVKDVSEVRARWIGHWLHAEVNIAVSPDVSVTDSHAIALEARHAILHHVPSLANAVVHVDPVGESGETHHRVVYHLHDNLQPHFHP